jgi:hypothetical protein
MHPSNPLYQECPPPISVVNPATMRLPTRSSGLCEDAVLQTDGRGHELARVCYVVKVLARLRPPMAGLAFGNLHHSTLSLEQDDEKIPLSVQSLY